MTETADEMATKRKPTAMTLNEAPAAKTELLIRKPVDEVFRAFIDPAVTTQFWFTKSSGKLEIGKAIRWDWEMYGVHTDVDVKAIEKNKRILIEWSSYVGRTLVEWLFKSRPDGTTFVTIAERGFQGNGDEIVKQALELDSGLHLRAEWPQGVARAWRSPQSRAGRLPG